MHSLTPQKIRISAGSAAVLGLKPQGSAVNPSTCYLMTHPPMPCLGHCTFCPQGHNTDAKNSARLSRVQWPAFDWSDFMAALERNQIEGRETKFRRICLQVLNAPDFFSETVAIVKQIHTQFPQLPLSGAFPPLSAEKLQIIHDAGLERIGIALDAVTPDLFDRVKGHLIHGPYTWQNHWESLNNAITVFGKGYVTTHFIIGLGDTEEQAINAIGNAISKAILPGIFCFTPIKGTPLANAARPPLLQFRHIQLARYLLLLDSAAISRFLFQNGTLIGIKQLTSEELHAILDKGIAFKTAGCPNCNRPYYTSRPGEEPDGFPRDLTTQEKNKIYADLEHLIIK